MSGGGAAHRESERFCVDRLHEVAVGAGVDHFADALCIGKGRQCDDSQGVVGGSQLPDRLDTPDPGHHEVHDHHVGLRSATTGQCSFARTGLADHLEVVEPGETAADPSRRRSWSSTTITVVRVTDRTALGSRCPGRERCSPRTPLQRLARSLMILASEMAARHLVGIEPGTVVGDAQFHGRSGNEADRQRREFACWATLPSDSCAIR